MTKRVTERIERVRVKDRPFRACRAVAGGGEEKLRHLRDKVNKNEEALLKCMAGEGREMTSREQ